jgi:hypothetical protein
MLARVYGVRLDVVTRLGELELFAGVSGRSRLSPDICGECARKLSMEGTFSLVTGLPPLVCKSIAKASKVRILHLPPRAREASDLRKRGSEALFVYLVGVSKRRRFGGPQGFGSQACDLRKRANRIGWRWVRPEYTGKFGSTPPCAPDSASADLRGRWG